MWEKSVFGEFKTKSIYLDSYSIETQKSQGLCMHGKPKINDSFLKLNFAQDIEDSEGFEISYYCPCIS